jgi:hypothetical protein
MASKDKIYQYVRVNDPARGRRQKQPVTAPHPAKNSGRNRFGKHPLTIAA